MHDGFLDSIGVEDNARLEEGYGDDPADETASTACARWLADDRRKTFLAHVGVGTVDQALLAVLPVKHAAVRQIGLTRKVLIVDEAHAYDAYMQIEIERLLEHQGRTGAPVIILSATLPIKTRRNIAAAHAKGLGQVAPQLASQSYPLATNVGGDEIEAPLRVRPDLKRRLYVERCADAMAAESMLGGCSARGSGRLHTKHCR